MLSTGDIRWLTQSSTYPEISENLEGLMLMSVIFGGPHPQYAMGDVSMILLLPVVYPYYFDVFCCSLNQLFFYVFMRSC